MVYKQQQKHHHHYHRHRKQQNVVIMIVNMITIIISNSTIIRPEWQFTIRQRFSNSGSWPKFELGDPLVGYKLRK
jgi:hypothetical protein